MLCKLEILCTISYHCLWLTVQCVYVCLQTLNCLFLSSIHSTISHWDVNAWVTHVIIYDIQTHIVSVQSTLCTEIELMTSLLKCLCCAFVVRLSWLFFATIYPHLNLLRERFPNRYILSHTQTRTHICDWSFLHNYACMLLLHWCVNSAVCVKFT